MFNIFQKKSKTNPGVNVKDSPRDMNSVQSNYMSISEIKSNFIDEDSKSNFQPEDAVISKTVGNIITDEEFKSDPSKVFLLTSKIQDINC